MWLTTTLKTSSQQSKRLKKKANAKIAVELIKTKNKSSEKKKSALDSVLKRWSPYRHVTQPFMHEDTHVSTSAMQSHSMGTRVDRPSYLQSYAAIDPSRELDQATLPGSTEPARETGANESRAIRCDPT